LLLGGCLGYQVGPTNGATAGAQTVQIRPFVNKTTEPHLTDTVETALRKKLQQDGTYQLATHEPGDIILSGVITDYRREALSFQPQDVFTPTDFRVVVTAQVTARERSTDRIIFNQKVTGATLVRVGSDLTSAERQARPLLANSLASNIASLLVDGGW
jgi:Lipopolysaccharide-assembly